MSKQNNKPWFIKVRGSYLPHAWQGWLLYIPYLAYTLGAYIFVMSRGYDGWSAIFILVPNWIAALVVMTWLAEQTSRPV